MAAHSHIRLLTGAVLLFADGIYNDHIFADLCYTGVYFCLPSITSLLGSFSISLSEDGDEGTEPCEGLYLNIWV